MRYPFRRRHGRSDGSDTARSGVAFLPQSRGHYGVSQGWSVLAENGCVATPILALRTSPSTSVPRQQRPFPQHLGDVNIAKLTRAEMPRNMRPYRPGRVIACFKKVS